MRKKSGRRQDGISGPSIKTLTVLLLHATIVRSKTVVGSAPPLLRAVYLILRRVLWREATLEGCLFSSSPQSFCTVGTYECVPSCFWLLHEKQSG